MSLVTHPFFGSLNNDALASTDVCWEGELVCNGDVVDARLWGEPGRAFVMAELDWFAVNVGQPEKLDATARQHLTNYLTNSRDFIDFHFSDVEGSAVLDALPREPASVVESFVRAMQLRVISLWATEPGRPRIIVDYMIDAECSDEILAVKFDLDGTVAVDWES